MRFFYSWKLRDTANMPSPDGKSTDEEFTPLLLCFDLKGMLMLILLTTQWPELVICPAVFREGWKMKNGK